MRFGVYLPKLLGVGAAVSCRDLLDSWQLWFSFPDLPLHRVSEGLGSAREWCVVVGILREIFLFDKVVQRNANTRWPQNTTNVFFNF